MRFGQSLENALEESVQRKPKQKELTEAQRNERRQKVLESYLQIKVERKYRDPFSDAPKG